MFLVNYLQNIFYTVRKKPYKRFYVVNLRLSFSKNTNLKTVTKFKKSSVKSFTEIFLNIVIVFVSMFFEKAN